MSRVLYLPLNFSLHHIVGSFSVIGFIVLTTIGPLLKLSTYLLNWTGVRDLSCKPGTTDQGRRSLSTCTPPRIREGEVRTGWYTCSDLPMSSGYRPRPWEDLSIPSGYRPQPRTVGSGRVWSTSHLRGLSLLKSYVNLIGTYRLCGLTETDSNTSFTWYLNV